MTVPDPALSLWGGLPARRQAGSLPHDGHGIGVPAFAKATADEMADKSADRLGKPDLLAPRCTRLRHGAEGCE